VVGTEEALALSSVVRTCSVSNTGVPWMRVRTWCWNQVSFTLGMLADNMLILAIITKLCQCR